MNSLAIFKTIFGYYPNEFSSFLIKHGKLGDNNGFRSQLFSAKRGSIATTSTVVYCLLRSNTITKTDAAKLMDEVSPPYSCVSRFPDEGTHRSMWALGITAFAESLLLDMNRVQLKHRVSDVMDLQGQDGGWSFDGDETGKSRLLFSLYPILALINSALLFSNERKYEEVLDNSVAFVRGYKAANLTEEIIQQHLAKVLRKAGLNCRLKTPIKVFSQRMESSRSISSLKYTLMETSIPLFYSDLFVPSLYLMVRKFYPINSRIGIDFTRLLRKYLCADTPTFYANQTEGNPCVWSSALGLYAGTVISSDLEKLKEQARSAILAQIMSEERGSGDKYDYDLAISFSGKQRHLARKIYSLASKLGYVVFYDEAEVHKLVGKELSETLTDIYMAKSRYVVIIISNDYVQSNWAYNIEWRATLSRALQERNAYIIPYRIDDAALDGLRPTVGYLDAERYSVGELVRIIDRKIQEDANGSGA